LTWVLGSSERMRGSKHLQSPPSERRKDIKSIISQLNSELEWW
jgi:hypothetical protein